MYLRHNFSDLLMYSNPLHTGRLFHFYMLDESICHFRDVESILSLVFYFLWKSLSANNGALDQMPHHLASYLGLRCLPIILLRVFLRTLPSKTGLTSEKDSILCSLGL